METSKLQWWLTNLNKDNFDEIVDETVDTQFVDKRLEELIFEIFYIYRIRPQMLEILVKFIEMLSKRHNNWNQLKDIYDRVFRFAAQPTTRREEADQVMCIRLLKELYKHGHYKIDKIIQTVKGTPGYMKGQIGSILVFFGKDIISIDRDWLISEGESITGNYTVNINIKNILSNIEKVDWEELDKQLINGWPENSIESLIINDDVGGMRSHTDFSFDYQVPKNFLDHNDIVRYGCSITAFAAFYRATKCFNFLTLNNAINPADAKAAVAGGDVNIIKVFANETDITEYLEVAADFRQYDFFTRYVGVKDRPQIVTQRLTDVLDKCAFSNNLGLLSFCHRCGVPASEEQRLLFECASSDQHLESLKLLTRLESVNVNGKNTEGWTPLHNAAQNGALGVIKHLVTCVDLDVNCRDRLGRTPLHIASANDNIECVAFLLHVEGVDINVTDGWGRTPLHLAAANGMNLCVEFLLRCPGIRVNQTDRYDKTALQLAEEPKCIKLLQAAMDALD